MIRQPAHAVLLSLALLAPLTASAEQPAEPQPWYQVELFVFAQRDDNLMAEFWDDRIQAPEAASGIPLLEADQTPVTPPAPLDRGLDATVSTEQPSIDPSVYADDAFRRLSPEQLQLPAGADRFNNRGYRTLFHAAWRQPVGERSTAIPVLIQSEERLADGQPALVGTVALSISRYLHLDTDLYLRIHPPVGWVSMRPRGEEEPLANVLSPPSEASESALSSFSSAAESAYALQPLLLSPETQVLTLRLNQSRRMRSGELHYLDHPMLGVLARITPFERPAPEPEPLLPAPVPAQPASPQPTTTPATPGHKTGATN